MSEDLQATVLLTEHIWLDRGRFSLLGIGPTRAFPGRMRLSAMVIVGVRPRMVRSSFALTIELYAKDDPAHIVAHDTIQLEGEAPSQEALIPDLVQVLSPVRLEADLAPSTMYVLQVRNDDEILTSTYFVTGP